MKKIGALWTTAILLATGAAISAAQGTGTGQQAPHSAQPDFSGCIDCTTPIPTLPQWFAIVMGLVLIGLSIFLVRRSKAKIID